MKIVLKRSIDGKVEAIEGYVKDGSGFPDISFLISFEEWKVSGSRALPSNVEEAKKILDCMNMAYSKLQEVIEEESK